MSSLRTRTGTLGPGWFLPLWWRTGPGPNDFSATGHLSTAPQGVFGSYPGTQGVGGTLSTPSLSANTEVMMAATTCCMNSSTFDTVSYTGSVPPVPQSPGGTPGIRQFVSRTLFFDPRHAAIFPGQNNTVQIGFTASSRGSTPLPLNFLDYPIRVLMSNVCVK